MTVDPTINAAPIDTDSNDTHLALSVGNQMSSGNNNFTTQQVPSSLPVNLKYQFESNRFPVPVFPPDDDDDNDENGSASESPQEEDSDDDDEEEVEFDLK